jgi:hypothetical protein
MAVILKGVIYKKYFKGLKEGYLLKGKTVSLKLI